MTARNLLLSGRAGPPHHRLRSIVGAVEPSVSPFYAAPGRIDDEYDIKPSPIRKVRPGVWRLEARTSVERVNLELDFDLPESDEYETVAGLVLERLRRLPEAGETLEVGNVTIRVSGASDRAIEEVVIQRRRRKG